MTRQDIFNKVATHLAAQGKPASDEAGHCFYRMGGLSCAIGCLIPDDRYEPEMDKGSGLKYVQEKMKDILDINDGFFLRELQLVHDTTSGSIRDAMETFAYKYRLDPGILFTLTFPEKWSHYK